MKNTDRRDIKKIVWRVWFFAGFFFSQGGAAANVLKPLVLVQHLLYRGLNKHGRGSLETRMNHNKQIKDGCQQDGRLKEDG